MCTPLSWDRACLFSSRTALMPVLAPWIPAMLADKRFVSSSIAATLVFICNTHISPFANRLTWAEPKPIKFVSNG
jgi:hypothetical protein